MIREVCSAYIADGYSGPQVSLILFNNAIRASSTLVSPFAINPSINWCCMPLPNTKKSTFPPFYSLGIFPKQF